MVTTRLHNSTRPVRTLFADVPQATGPKPKGLWYGVGSAWLDWCRSEGQTDWIGRFTYDVGLTVPTVPLAGDRGYGQDGAHVLALATTTDLLAFTERFAVLEDWQQGSLLSRHPYAIDWPAVARLWCGIEIAPYNWELRLDSRTSWYYGWDCASGCIWKPVATLKRVARPKGKTDD